jgi:hypothetical protein
MQQGTAKCAASRHKLQAPLTSPCTAVLMLVSCHAALCQYNNISGRPCCNTRNALHAALELYQQTRANGFLFAEIAKSQAKRELTVDCALHNSENHKHVEHAMTHSATASTPINGSSSVSLLVLQTGEDKLSAAHAARNNSSRHARARQTPNTFPCM